MKNFLALIGVAAVALSLSACANDTYASGEVGYGDGNWAGPVAYDGWYDGYYGNVYDGYWGSDNYFYYRHGGNDRRYYRGDRDHFARGDAVPGRNYHRFQGSINSQPQGVRMPHFGGNGGGMRDGGGHGGGDHGDHGGQGHGGDRRGH